VSSTSDTYFIELINEALPIKYQETSKRIQHCENALHIFTETSLKLVTMPQHISMTLFVHHDMEKLNSNLTNAN